jgi:hypothetical protein
VKYLLNLSETLAFNNNKTNYDNEITNKDYVLYTKTTILMKWGEGDI